MRYLFFLVLLTNVLLFVWEFQSGVFTSQKLASDHTRSRENINNNKQILLVNELSGRHSLPHEKPAELQDIQNRNFGITKTEDALLLDQLVTQKFDQILAGEQIIDKSSSMSEHDKFSSQILETGLNVAVKQTDTDKPDENNRQTQDQKNVNQTAHQYDSHVVAYNNPKISEIYPENVEINSTENSKNQQKSSLENNGIQSYCVEIGSLDDVEQIRQWHTELEFQADIFNIISRDVETVGSYLVFYPAAETFEQSETNAEFFKDLGTTDLWLFREGEMKGAISLGLFQQKSRALIVLEKFKNLGVDVKVKARYISSTQNFALLKWQISQAALDKIKVDFNDRFPELSFKELPDCSSLKNR